MDFLLDINDNLIQSWGEQHSQLKFIGSAAVINYQSSGFLSGSSVTFMLAEANCAGTEARQISISRVGHARATNAPCPEVS